LKRFLLEADLHKIAYWLRLLGQDALLLEGAINKKDLLKHPGRVFITTSRKMEEHLKAWGVEYFLLPKDDWKVQLCLILKFFDIKGELKLNRCYYCNSPLMPVSKEEIKDKIPPMVYKYGRDFTLCQSFGKIYWKGSHHSRLKRILKEVLSSC